MGTVKLLDKIRSVTMLVFASIWLVGSFIISDGVINYWDTLLGMLEGGEYGMLWAIFAIPLSLLCLCPWLVTEIIAVACNLVAGSREKYLKNGCYKQYETSFVVTNIVTTIAFVVAAFISAVWGLYIYESGQANYITDSFFMTCTYILTINPIVMLMEGFGLVVLSIVEFGFSLTNKGKY